MRCLISTEEHQLATYEIPIERRDEWLAAARRLA
jgi:hypothetical protein